MVEISKQSLSGELTLEHVLDLKARLLECLEAGSAVEFDLADVTAIDTAGLQLLMLAMQEAERLQTTLVLVAPSDPVREAFELLGMGHALEETSLSSDYGFF